MEKEILLEGKTHGDVMFPLEVYMVDYLFNGEIFNWHWHPEIEFILMEDGIAEFHIGTSVITLHSGEGLFIPSGQLHAAFPLEQSPFRFQAIVFNMNLVKSFQYDAIQGKYLDILNELDNGFPPLITITTNSGRSILDLLSKIVSEYENKKTGYELKIKGQLYMLISDIVSTLPLTHQKTEKVSNDIEKINRLKRVLLHIDKHSHEKLNVYDLASILQMSEGHFSRFFKSFVRMTPIEYVNMIRVNRAAKLLKETDQRIIEISMEVGFDNPSYFIKLFKRLKNCTPSEFRKTANL